MVTKYSYPFTTRSHGIHRAEIILSKNGEYILAIDGKHAYSPYEDAAKRSPYYKTAITNVTSEMQQAIEAYNNAFVQIAPKTSQILNRSVVEKKLNTLVLKKYSRVPFTLPKPNKLEVLVDLKKEADVKFYSVWKSNSSFKEKFISDQIDYEYNQRMLNWEDLNRYHDTIQDYLETLENKKYNQEYIVNKQSLEDELYGKEAYVKKKLQELSQKVKVPFDLSLDVDYRQKEGLINAVVTLPSLLNIPDKKVVPLATGRISVKDKLKREYDEDTINTLIGLAYNIADHLFSLSVNVKIVRLSAVSGFMAYYWIEFNRTTFSAISFGYHNLLQDFFCHPYIINLKNSSIEAIPEVEFQNRVADIININDLLLKDNTLIRIGIQDAEMIINHLDECDDLIKEVKKAKEKKSNYIVANKRYKNILQELNNNSEISSFIKARTTGVKYDIADHFTQDSTLDTFHKAMRFKDDYYNLFNTICISSNNYFIKNMQAVCIQYDFHHLIVKKPPFAYRDQLFFYAIIDLYNILAYIKVDNSCISPASYPLVLFVAKVVFHNDVSILTTLHTDYNHLYQSYCSLLKPIAANTPVTNHVLLSAELLFNHYPTMYPHYIKVIGNYLDIISQSFPTDDKIRHNIEKFVVELHAKGVDILTK